MTTPVIAALPDLDEEVRCYDGCGLIATHTRTAEGLLSELVCGACAGLGDGATMVGEMALSRRGPHATLSRDEVYRWTLTRAGWEAPRGTLAWIMLNPSSADADVDDNTIRRVMGFTKAYGYSRAVVVNLYAYRTPKPTVLLAAQAAGVDVVGALNDAVISTVVGSAGLVIAAWGALPGIGPRVAAVRALVGAQGHGVWCLGRTMKGAPRHPLYLPKTAPMELL